MLLSGIWPTFSFARCVCMLQKLYAKLKLLQLCTGNQDAIFVLICSISAW
jgi:hypothetical protein